VGNLLVETPDTQPREVNKELLWILRDTLMRSALAVNGDTSARCEAGARCDQPRMRMRRAVLGVFRICIETNDLSLVGLSKAALNTSS